MDQVGRRSTSKISNGTLSSWSNSVFPLNNGSLAKSSAIMQPNDHMSIAVEYSFAPKRSSGALLLQDKWELDGIKQNMNQWICQNAKWLKV